MIYRDETDIYICWTKIFTKSFGDSDKLTDGKPLIIQKEELESFKKILENNIIQEAKIQIQEEINRKFNTKEYFDQIKIYFYNGYLDSDYNEPILSISFEENEKTRIDKAKKELLKLLKNDDYQKALEEINKEIEIDTKD